MNTKGTIKHIYEVQQVSEKFRKREFILDVTDGQYTEPIKFELKQDKCDLISPFRVGQQVDVSFNLRGREWNKDGKTVYFTSLEAWKIAAIGQIEPAPIASPELPGDDDTPF